MAQVPFELIVIASCFAMLVNWTSCELLPPLFWNSSNPTFFNEDASTMAKIRDSIEIHCPLYNDSSNSVENEYSIIYMVSKFGFDNCVLDDEKPVGQCLTPFRETVLKMTFREFTPMPHGLEFRYGQTYYFISTSSGTLEGLHNRVGGLCSTKHLKHKVQMAERVPTTISPKFLPILTSTTHFEQPSTTTELSLNRNDIFDDGGSWEEDNVQEILSFDSDAILNNKLTNPLALPYEKIDNPEKSQYNVQHLILYEIHEASDFDVQTSLSSSSESNHIYHHFIFLCLALLVFKFFHTWL